MCVISRGILERSNNGSYIKAAFSRSSSHFLHLPGVAKLLVFTVTVGNWFLRVSLSLREGSSLCLDFFKLLGCLYSYLSSNLGNFQPSFLLILSAPFPLSFPSGTPTMCVWVCLILSHRFLRHQSLFYNLCLFLLLKLNFHRPIFKFINSFSFLLRSALNPSGNFSFLLLYFSVPEFLF